MLATTITLDDATGDDVSFNQILHNVPGETKRIDPLSPFSEPRTLTIRHQTTGKNGAQALRHNVTFATTRRDTNGTQSSGTVSISMAHPVNGVITEADMIDMLSMAIDLLTSGASTGLADQTNAKALLRGEG